MIDFGLKPIAVGNVKQRDAGAVPRTSARDARLINVLTIPLNVDVGPFAVERTRDRTCPFDDIAREVINAVAIRSIAHLRSSGADDRDLSARILLPVVEIDLAVAERAAEREIEAVRPARGLLPFGLRRQ